MAFFLRPGILTSSIVRQGRLARPATSLSRPLHSTPYFFANIPQHIPKPSSPDLQAQALKQRRDAYKKRNQSLLLYTAAVFIVGIGVTYAAVPLYRAFCSATGFSGTPIVGLGRFEPSKLFPQYFDSSTNSATKRIRVTFNADHSDALPWSFKPSQEEIYVLPGETALAFYKAHNKGNKDITGIATYNVAPDKVRRCYFKPSEH